MDISDVMSMGTSWDCSLYCPTNSSLTPQKKHSWSSFKFIQLQTVLFKQ